MISVLLLVLVPVATEVFKTDFTAGNTKCRHGNICGYHQGKTYSWCYTDYSNNWGYCCTAYCRYKDDDYLWCPSGTTWQYCGGHRTYDISGRPCLDDHPCGMHFEEGESGSYWCFVDMNRNWGYCCESSCDYRGESYTWCYTSGHTSYGEWDYCKKM